MPLDVDRDQQVESLFAEALDVPEAERLNWLGEACAGNRELLAEVRSLLDAYAVAPRFMDRSILPGWSDHRPDDEPDRRAGQTLGPWRILRLIATGGMGAVYLGERTDDSFRMKVAIKILAAGSFHPGLLSRFRAERQILADLDHPGIARLLDGGTTPEGTPYLVMEYVDGDSISRAARDRGLSVEERLRLFLEVADAVQYAHTNLVIHRDLKPGNIFVRQDGHPRLLDFGIAKVFRPAGTPDGAETVAGTAWALTPRYASPEQIRGRRVTTATDIYSLGVVLYELLTGRLPYDAGVDSIIDISQAICEADPTPPSRLRELPDARRFRGDLDTILLKALAKEPARRYSSVADFAEDIRRHLDGEPVTARGDSAGYRLGRFAARHRGLVAGVLGFIATLLVALVVILSFYREARENAARARWSAYTSTLAAAESAVMNHNMREARELLGGLTTEFQGWEYRHLRARLDRSRESWKGHDAGITKLEFSVDGQRILTTGIDRAARVWSTESKDSLASWTADTEIESGSFFPDGDRVALGLSDGRVMTATAGDPEPEPLGRGTAFAIIDVHPDGSLVAGGFENGEVALFDAGSRREVRRWKAHYRLAVPAFSPDGTLLATAGSDSAVRIWDLEDGRLMSTLRGHRHRIFALDWSPDGQRLASGSRDRTAIVWDLDTGRALSTFSEHRGTPSPLAFHPDGKAIISAGTEGRVMVWDSETGAREAEYHGHQADVSAVDVAPDGGMTATGEWDGTVRLWTWGTDDIRTLALPRSGDIFPFVAVDVEPSGRKVAAIAGHSYAPARKVMVQDIDGTSMRLHDLPAVCRSVIFVDSSALVVGNDWGRLLRLDRMLSPVDSIQAHEGGVVSLAVDRDDSLLASGGNDGFVRLWRLPAVETVRGWKGHDGAVNDVEFNPRGDVLASAGRDGTIRLWNPGTGDSLAGLEPDDSPVNDLAFHPGGDLLAFTRESGAAYLWDIESGVVSDTLLSRGHGAVAVTFSPDGERVAVGDNDTMIYIFDVTRRSPIVRLHGHLSRVSALRFTPDGTTLLSASHDGTIRIWDASRAD